MNTALTRSVPGAPHDALPSIVEWACRSEREEVLTVLSAAGVVLNTWGFAAEARDFLADVLRRADSSFNTRWIYLRVLSAEAARRSGDARAALRSLHEALWTDSSYVRFTFPGVLAAARLAADLGDPAATEFGEDWERVRRAAGLAVPLGFDPVPDIASGVGDLTWPLADFQGLACDARAWCARALHGG